MPRSEIDSKPTQFLLDLYQWKSSRSRDQKSHLNHKNQVRAPQPIFRLKPVLRSRARWMKIKAGPLEEGSSCTGKNLYPSLRKGLLRLTVSWGKGNNQDFEVLLDSGSVWTLIPGDQKCHCGLPDRVGVYEGQVLEFWFRSVSQWVQWVLMSPSCSYFLSSGMPNWKRHT